MGKDIVRLMGIFLVALFLAGRAAGTEAGPGTARLAILGVNPLPPGDANAAPAICSTSGREGTVVTSGVLNTYYPGTSSVAAGANTLSLGASVGAGVGISPGDLVMIAQMQDALIDASDTAAYGDGGSDGSGSTDIRQSGLYEFGVAANAVGTGGGTLVLAAGLTHAYNQGVNRSFQVIRVPQYRNLTLNGTVTATPWNGSAGGVVVLDVLETLDFNGQVMDVAGLGFRPGVFTGGSWASGRTEYRVASGGLWAEKGEGIAGTPDITYGGGGYPNGSLARGAPGNAGGGGNDHNGGGGGGGNIGAGGLGGIGWRGGAASQGRGGGSFAGHSGRLLPGGGGGAGHRNNGTGASAGGAGGGIVFINATRVTGGGKITAAGAKGQDSNYGGSAGNDAAGGGGAGGTVLIRTASSSLAGISIDVSGGNGGNVNHSASHGPGGGGGGGAIYVDASGATTNVAGGLPGTHTVGSAGNHGATAGGAGQVQGLSSQPAPVACDYPDEPGYGRDASMHRIDGPAGDLLQLSLGAGVDFEGLHPGNAAADADDVTDTSGTAAGNDENGVAFRSPSGNNQSIFADVSINNPTGALVTVCGWLDIPSGGVVDGVYDAADGQCQSTTATGGVLTFQWSNLPRDQAYTTYARFRITTDSLTPADATGMVTDGETESYRLFFDFRPTSAVVDGFRVNWRPVDELLRENPGLKDALSGLDAGAGVAVVRWETLQEHGTLGFVLERRQGEDGNWEIAGRETFLPGLITAPLGGEYLFLDKEVRPGERWYYRLTEKEVWGSERHHGPWDITIGGSTEDAARTVAGKEHDSAHWRAWQELLDGYAARARQALPPSARRASVRRNGGPAASATAGQLRLRIRDEGLYRVSLEALSRHLSLDPGRLADRLLRGEWRLSLQGRNQPYFYAPGEQALYFAGRSYRSIDTVENVYRFQPGGGLPMPMFMGSEAVEAVPVGSFRDSLHFEEENWLLTYVHQDEDADYGYWDYVYTLNRPAVDLEVDIPAPAQSPGRGRLRVALRGQTDLVEGNDHLARVYLNGQLLDGQIEWDGNEPAVLEVPFDQSLLLEGSMTGDVLKATVTVEGQAINGAPYSLFFIESVDLTYDRRYQARNGNVWIHGAPMGRITVTGFDGPDIRIMANPLDEDAYWISSPTVRPDGKGGWQASFVGEGGDYLLSSNLHTARIEADQASALSSWYNRAEYLVIAPRSLAEGAEALVDLRRRQMGEVRIAWLQDIYDEFSHGRTDSRAIRDFLKTVRQRWSQVPEYVVLLGRGTLDHANRRGYGESLIPLRMAATPWGLAPSDNRYADIDGDHLPDFSLGRVAVSDNAQLLAYVDKLRAHQAAAPGDWSARALVVADDPDDAGDFHANADALGIELESLGYEVEKLYHPDQAVGSLLRDGWAAGNFGYVTYDGHGSATMLGSRSEDFLSTAQVADLVNGDHLPVFTAFSCAVGDSSYPGQLSLGDSLTLSSVGGAIAGFLPSGLSLDAPASRLSTYYSRNLLGERMTVGQAARASLEQAAGEGMAPFMLDIYGISGDPAVELKY